MKQETEPFEQLPFPRRDLQETLTLRYRVYKDATNYDLVEATSALEALQLSGQKTAYKVERHNPLGDNIIQLGAHAEETAWKKQELFISPEVAAKTVVMIEPPHHAAPPAPIPAEQTASALSNEEVEKLLKS